MSKNCRYRFSSGINLTSCEKDARLLGCTIEAVAGTGEIRFSHPSVAQSVRVDSRRKDAPRQLTAWLSRVLGRSAMGNGPKRPSSNMR